MKTIRTLNTETTQELLGEGWEVESDDEAIKSARSWCAGSLRAGLNSREGLNLVEIAERRGARIAELEQTVERIQERFERTDTDRGIKVLRIAELEVALEPFAHPELEPGTLIPVAHQQFSERMHAARVLRKDEE